MEKNYGKKSARPSANVGEQSPDMDCGKCGGGYNTNRGARDVVYNGDKVKNLRNEGGKGSPNKCDYPKKRQTFGTMKGAV